MYRGVYVSPSRATVTDYLEQQWLPSIRSTVKPTTADLYATQVRAYVNPHLGSWQLARVTGAHLNNLYTILLDAGGRGGKPLSAKLVRNVHVMLHRAFRDAVRWDFLLRNPAESADPPRVVPPAVESWDAATLAAFLEATAADRLGPLWLLLATTALRRGEALALRWADFDAGSGRITVSRALSWLHGQAIESEPKTRTSRRSVPVPPTTAAALREHRKRQLEERLAAGPVYEDRDLIFCTEVGAHLNPKTVTRTFAAAVSHHGAPKLSVHGLRHTWATLALRAGVPAKVAAEVLGHSSVAITLDVYASVLPGMAEDATARVAALLTPQG